MQNALVLTNGLFNTIDAKTAHGLVRGTTRFIIKGIIDCAESAGLDAGELLDGNHRNIPIFANLQNALQHIPQIDYLIVGVATVGGYFPANMIEIIKEAIKLNISIVNGLHDHLTEMPEMVDLANKNNVQLIDIRKPKKRSDLHFWKGDIFKVTAPIVAVLGTDCVMGKRTTTQALKNMCNENNLQAAMIYTGQTGWLQGEKYGFIFDSTLNDFVSGELENAIYSCWTETNPQIIFLEGQSALRNPSGPCGLELLISGNATHVVLIFSPKRTYYDNEEAWGKIPSVESEIELIEKIGSKVIAVALHTAGCTLEEKMYLKTYYQDVLKIPVLLPIENGVQELLPVLQNLK
ncbi:MAG: DUF1611 domain-containing protein [Sediminibacterium sp.]|nr:DUF1611 domain-containing protein [Sediminibacterium sp.]